MYSNQPFPIDFMCDYLKNAWTKGWLDEYSKDHFVIRAIENRLNTFVGIEQLVNNDSGGLGVFRPTEIDFTNFSLNFCINLSNRLSVLEKTFGEEKIKNFVRNQLSAGKENYSEDSFYEALSEISVLSFYASRFRWEQALYEPAVLVGENRKNPEASFIGKLSCKIDGKEDERKITVNVEVKSPQFPHDVHPNDKIVIPTVLLTSSGRKIVKEFCLDNQIIYLDPRVLKIKDFMNSAASKFQVPKENEYNILYINWSYRDFPSNSFLEAWSLLTNEINGLLHYPDYAKKIGVLPDAFEKITAVVVYTESLAGLMFLNFSHVWQCNGRGNKFRMWIINDEIRNAEQADCSDVLFNITGMNPSEPLTQMCMIDLKSNNIIEIANSTKTVEELYSLIQKNTEYPCV